MVFSAEDKILIKELRETKGYGARRFITEFPMKNWSLIIAMFFSRSNSCLSSAINQGNSSFSSKTMPQPIEHMRLLRSCDMRLQPSSLLHFGHQTVQISIQWITRSGGCCRIEFIEQESGTLNIFGSG